MVDLIIISPVRNGRGTTSKVSSCHRWIPKLSVTTINLPNLLQLPRIHATLKRSSVWSDSKSSSACLLLLASPLHCKCYRTVACRRIINSPMCMKNQNRWVLFFACFARIPTIDPLRGVPRQFLVIWFYQHRKWKTCPMAFGAVAKCSSICDNYVHALTLFVVCINDNFLTLPTYRDHCRLLSSNQLKLLTHRTKPDTGYLPVLLGSFLIVLCFLKNIFFTQYRLPNTWAPALHTTFSPNSPSFRRIDELKINLWYHTMTLTYIVVALGVSFGMPEQATWQKSGFCSIDVALMSHASARP